jgi:hypothetical protein
MRNYNADPNSPDCPTNSAFKPTHVYEFHIVNGGGGPVQKPTQTKAQWVQSPQPNMGYAEMEISVSLPETEFPSSALPNTIELVSLQLSFTGKAKSSILMTQIFFDGNQQFFPLSFQSDIKSWLGQFEVSATIDPLSLGVSAAMISPPGSNSLVSTSISIDADGRVVAGVGAEINGNEADVSIASDKPMTIIFTFSPHPVTDDYGKTSFEGQLEAELSVTFYPIKKIQTNAGSLVVPDNAHLSFLSILGLVIQNLIIENRLSPIRWVLAPATTN